jgi:hypothetical protein
VVCHGGGGDADPVAEGDVGAGAPTDLNDFWTVNPRPDCHRPDVVFRPISDLPPFPLLLLTAAGRQRRDVEAFATLSTTVANALNSRH